MIRWHWILLLTAILLVVVFALVATVVGHLPVSPIQPGPTINPYDTPPTYCPIGCVIQ